MGVFTPSVAGSGISKSYTLGCAAEEELIFLPSPLFGAQQNICAVTS